MSQIPPGVLPYPGPVPLTLGQTLDRIFRLFRSHFGLFLKISALPTLAMLLIYGFFFGLLFLLGIFPQPGHVPDPQRTTWVFLPVGMVMSIAGMCVYVVLEVAACRAALRIDAGFPVTPRDSFGTVTGKLGRFLWLMIVRGLIVSVPAMLCFGLLAAGMGFTVYARGGWSHSTLPFALIPLFVLLYMGWIVYAIFVILRLALAVPASLAENLTATQALKRSLQLTRNAKGRIFVVLLVVYAATYAAILIVELMAGVVAGLGMLLAIVFHLHFSPPWSYIGVGALAACVMGILMMLTVMAWTLYALAFAVLYHDQRLRMEGVPPGMPAGEPA
jgi:hypothetical protein